MTPDGFLRLAVQTVTAPRDVARLLLALRLGREPLILLFALAVVVNALLYGVVLLMPGAPPVAVSAPVFGVLMAASLLATIVAVTQSGRWLGGTARLAEVAILLIWLQGLRALVQALVVPLSVIAPGLSALVMLLASALGIWITVNFLDVAHGLGSLGRAAMVLILGIVGMALALMVLLALLGVNTNGMTGNV